MSYEVIGDAKILGQEKGAKITKKSLEEKDGVWYLTVEDNSWDYKTLAEWKDWVKAEAEKAAAEAAAAKAAEEEAAARQAQA